METHGDFCPDKSPASGLPVGIERNIGTTARSVLVGEGAGTEMNNLLRLASVDSITAGELTAQTGAVRRLYSTVELDEKRDALGRVLKLVKGDA